MRENHSAQQLIQLPSVNRDSPKNNIDASISVIWVFFLLKFDWMYKFKSVLEENHTRWM